MLPLTKSWQRLWDKFIPRKMCVNYWRLAVIFLVFMGLSASSQGFFTRESASVVVGQQNMDSGQPNQNIGPGPNTLNEPCNAFAYGNYLLVADNANNRVLIFTSIPTTNNTSATYVIGQPDFYSNLANNGNPSSPEANSLNRPSSVCTDGTKLFIADEQNHRVLIYNSIPNQNYAAANVVIGQANMTSQVSGCTDKRLYRPTDVYVYANKLYLVDYGNSRLLIYDPIPTVNDASANSVVGQANMTGFSMGCSATQLSTPYGCWVFASKLFVADTGNNRVLIYNFPIAGSNDAADLVVGQTDMNSSAGNTSRQGLRYPSAVHAGPGGLFISDLMNNRVMVFDTIPAIDYPYADVVLGQPNFDTDSFSTSANALWGPRGLSQHTDNRLVVADNANHRVLIYLDITPTRTMTRTMTSSPTKTRTPTSTRTPTATPTRTASRTGTITLTKTSSVTSTPTPTQSCTPTITPTSTITPTYTPENTKTITPTYSITPTITPYWLPANEVLSFPSPASGDWAGFYYYAQAGDQARLEIYNAVGELCKTLTESIAATGYYRTFWNISQVAPGVYFYQLTLVSGRGTQVFPIHKLAIVKE